MNAQINKNYNTGNMKRDIINAILSSDEGVVQKILSEDPSLVNKCHEESLANSAMLATVGTNGSILNSILVYGQHLDFSHRDRFGRNLMEYGMMSMNSECAALVINAYKAYAPYLINNWPQP